LRSLLDRGISVALGSDAELNPFLGILLASVHPANPDEAISREQALVAYTRGSAYAEFAEAVKGTLAPGMLADLAVLSQDLFEVSNEQLPATTSVLTLVGGRVVYSAAAMEGGLSAPSQGD
jgi:predicted amidohydrolase YtcJ